MNNSINLFAFASLLTSITALILALICFAFSKSKLHQIWAFFNLSVSGWAILVYLAITSNQSQEAYNYWRYSHLIGIYVSIFFFHAVCKFTKSKSSYPIYISYFYGIVHNLIGTFKNGVILYKQNNTEFLFNSIFYIQANKVNFLIGILPWIILAIISFVKLYLYSKQNKNQDSFYAKLWLIASILGYIGGSSTFLPMFGIKIYPITMFLLPIYTISMTYAIFRHQLLNVEIFIKEGLKYTILIAILSLFYVLLVLISENIFKSILGYTTISMSIFLSFIIGLAFLPFRQSVQNFIEHYFFKGTTEEISQQNIYLKQEVADKEKFKAVATLASGIAHEIRNPLTALQTFFEYYPKHKDDPEFLTKFNHIARQEFNRIENLVQQLLDFSKPSSAEFKDIDIFPILESTLSLVEQKLNNNNIKLTKFLSANTPLSGDANKLKQAFLNIIQNAIEAMPDGGTLTVKTHLEGTWINIMIQDSGTGISPEDQKHLFDPFFTRKETGTGLGLAITQSIIDEHGGKIHIEKTTQPGTCFKIILPCRGKLI